MTTAEGPARSRWLGRRILFRIGRVRIFSYAVMLYLGCVAGIYAGAAVARGGGLDPTRFALVATLLLLPALAGARLWFVIQNRSLFRGAPVRVWRASEGGAGLDGGLVLSVLVSIPVLALAGLPFWAFWDAAIVSMAIGMIPTRLGCLMAGCCAGRATTGWFGMWLPNHRGEWRRRVPTPLLEIAWIVAVLCLAWGSRRVLPFTGSLFAIMVAAFAAGRMVLGFTRESADPAREARVNVAVCGAFIVAAAALLIWGLRP